MKRWTLALLILTLLLPSAAIAQTPTASEDDGVFTTIRKRAGLDIASEATASFELSGISFSQPLAYLFWVTNFEREEDAIEMMGLIRGEFENDYLERFSAEFEGEISLSEASFTDIGDDRIAFAGERAADGFTAYDGIVFVRVGSLILAASGTTLLGSMVPDLLPFIEAMVQESLGIDLENEEQLAAILPALNDLPPGYVVSDDD